LPSEDALGVLHASLFSSLQSLPVVYSFTGEYTWSQGQDATPMGSIYGRSCFLTRVGGQLLGNGERVEVYSGTSTSWRLGGSSLHFGVHARARCVVYGPPPLPQQPYAYTGWVDSGQARRVLQPTSWACYLAGIRGGFSSSHTVVAISRRMASGTWAARPVKRRTVQRWGAPGR